MRPGAVSYRDFRRYIARVHDLRVQRMPEAKWSVTDQTTALYVNQGYSDLAKSIYNRTPQSFIAENGPQIYLAFVRWNDMDLHTFSTFLLQAAMQLNAICQDARAVLEWLVLQEGMSRYVIAWKRMLCSCSAGQQSHLHQIDKGILVLEAEGI